jgi:hypothetical protein
MVDSSGMSDLSSMVDSGGMSSLSSMVNGSYMSDLANMTNSSGMTYLSSMVTSSGMFDLSSMVDSSGMSDLSYMVNGSYMSDLANMTNSSGMSFLSSMVDSSGMSYLSSMVNSSGMGDLANFTGELSSDGMGSISIGKDNYSIALNRGSVSEGALQVGNSSTNGNGAYLTGGGVWTNASSIDLKTNFIGLTNEWIFNKIKSINVSKWTYKDTDEVHIGPTSEEFAKAFNTGAGSDKFISTIDVSGVALRGVQGLIDRDESQAEEINELKSEIEQLKEQIELLKSLIE